MKLRSTIAILTLTVALGFLPSCGSLLTKDDARELGATLLQGGLEVASAKLTGGSVDSNTAFKALGNKLVQDVSKRVRDNLAKDDGASSEQTDPATLLDAATGDALTRLQDLPVSPETKAAAATAIASAAEEAAAQLNDTSPASSK